MASKYYKILRAHEEINWLNVECRRLQAWVDYEDQNILTISNQLWTSSCDPAAYALAAELYALHTERQQVNNIHRARLTAIYTIDGYSGTPPEGLGKAAINQELLNELEGNSEVFVEQDDALYDKILRLGDCVGCMGNS